MKSRNVANICRNAFDNICQTTVVEKLYQTMIVAFEYRRKEHARRVGGCKPLNDIVILQLID